MNSLAPWFLANVRPYPASCRQTDLHAYGRSSSRKPFQPLMRPALDRVGFIDGRLSHNLERLRREHLAPRLDGILSSRITGSSGMGNWTHIITISERAGMTIKDWLSKLAITSLAPQFHSLLLTSSLPRVNATDNGELSFTSSSCSKSRHFRLNRKAANTLGTQLVIINSLGIDIGDPIDLRSPMFLI